MDGSLFRMFSALTVSDYIKRLHISRPSGIAAYWIEEAGSRSALVSSISNDFAGLPILVAYSQRRDFDDANGIIDDLARTITDHVHWFTDDNRNAIFESEVLAGISFKGPLGVPQPLFTRDTTGLVPCLA